ncbi:single-stranded DNA-binding protein [Campylobacter sp. MIT 99-7217]|uniref:single-stranded DNA-binding protein n=1 Tax=Campylobacter sp. MIT 99-7217 TaxID=535091 RepID=UPI00115AEAB2|nr:single-stranded DNA-binding protein [Campylobacter sp. MIT 99-7217]TQR34544.1 single-stranded DNA-binding protein [Campylobacter sp. MIT 99-7217]
MFNKVVLVGNLTRDIEMRYTPLGAAIGSSGIAVTRRFNASSGEKKEETCFIDITFFGRSAEVANQYLNKGSKVLIEGRLKFDQWSDQNGQNRSKHSVYVESMEMLGSNPQSSGNFGQNHNQKQNQNYDPYETREAKVSQARPTQNYQEEKIKEIDIDDFDDDKTELPF